MLLTQKRGVFAALSTLAMLTACSDDTAQKSNNTAQNNAVNNVRPGIDFGNGQNNTNNSPDSGQPDQGGQSTPEDMGGSRDMNITPENGCTPGNILGCVDSSAEFVCDPEGKVYSPRTCPGEQTCLGGRCTDMACVPQESRCVDANSFEKCSDDGKSFLPATVCPADTLCSNGQCKTMCELGKYRSSYVGCDYWTIDLDQYTDPTINPKPDAIPHSVVISNPNDRPATIAFYAQTAAASVNVPDPVVPAKSAKAFTMPRLDVSGTGITKNSINVVSSIPVVAHQFSPLNNDGVYSNDASLLLPTNTLGAEYYVVNWPTQVLPCIVQPCPASQHSYVTIVATEPGETYVNVTTSGAKIAQGAGINPFGPGVTRSFKLVRGEVLNLEANSGSAFDMTGNDLTGTHIKGNKPVAVFAGHEEAVIGEAGMDESCCADHLQQQLFSLESWGKRYISVLSPGRGTKKDHWRIVAGEDGVTVTTNPPQPGANNVTLNKGQSVKFFSDQSFEVAGTGKILVGQFLVSQGQTSEGIGDPAFVLGVPVERYRADYVLLTPNRYRKNYVTITREAGKEVKLNGVAVANASFSPVGSSGFESASVEVQPGVQSLEGAAPFGIVAYGFDNAVSYAYPGGLNLVGQQAQP